MIKIFDLDDTLYLERSFVESGFKAVAKFLEKEFDWSTHETFSEMLELLDRHGRGSIFDSLLYSKQKYSKKLIKDCVKTYRYHEPKIKIFDDTKDIISSSLYPQYIVTDGNKLVQKNKTSSLGIESYFKKIFYTHAYGIHNRKPSTYCFEKIKKIEKCAWNQMIYIGDNPNKDFVNLRPLGVSTVRVLTGEYSDYQVTSEYDADYTIPNLSKLPLILEEMAYEKE